MTVRYTVIVERGPDGYGAFAPDVPGCGAAHETEEGVKALIAEALEVHLRAVREDGDPVPEPTCTAFEVDVPVEAPANAAPDPLAAAA